MLVEAIRDAGVGTGQCMYVGDRPEDRQAARDAGVRFTDAHRFFSR
jgi:phosphoglycolate phosphatase-like HAD superfamily hydrolase